MKLKTLALLVSCILLLGGSKACDTTAIAKTLWSIKYVDSQELTGEGPNNGHAIHCFDLDPNTYWHTQWQGAAPPYPHEIQIDLGGLYSVNGFSYLTRANTLNGRIKNFEFYLSTDGISWGQPQAAGILNYPNPTSNTQQTAKVFFGAVNARYVRLVGTSSVYGDVYVMLAEMGVYHDLSCGASGQTNQVITINPIPKQSTVSIPVPLIGTTSSGLPLTWSVVSGPATIFGNTLYISGTAGTVTVKATQAGNATWYPASATTSFDIINLANYYPTVNTKLTNNFALQMPQLYPYLLHASAGIEEPEFLSIASVKYTINGITTMAQYNNGDYQLWWTPPAYGHYLVSVTATATNGNTKTDTVSLNVTSTIATQDVQTLTDAIIDMGTIGSQWYYGTYTLPQSVGAYDTITAYLNVSCPSVPGLCDDWDRLAWVEFKAPDGKWMELIRYITPYGVPCNHVVDVTDYASLLQGNIELRMFIDTWGTGGWKMNLAFNYHAGPPQYLYSDVEELWHGTYSFGDPANLQPMDTVIVKPYQYIEKAKFRLVTTGHGWGDDNTSNAAEFYHAIHTLKINDADAFEQDLWTDCNPNPDGCLYQNGTWFYDRAGWCPGVIARPFSYDLTPYLAQAPFTFEYIFQTSYQDLCHPHNPLCVSGVTCPDCNDGYNPQYRIGGYLIRYSNVPVVLGSPAHATPQETDLGFRLYPNPTSGFFHLIPDHPFGHCICTLHALNGQTLKTYYFNDSDQLAGYGFNVSGLNKGVSFVQLQTENTSAVRKLVVE